MSHLLNDVRYAIRLLAKNPSFAAVCTLTIALGIGANAAIFGVVDALLWKPLPVPQPDRLVHVMERRADQTEGWIPASPGNYYDWKARSKSFESLGAYRQMSANLASDSRYNAEAERVPILAVTADFFRALGVAPVTGRIFSEREETQGEDRVAILSSRLWDRRYGSSTDVVGKTIYVDGRAITIVGVMPPAAEHLGEGDLWLPLAMPAPLRRARPATMLFTLGRLRPGVSIQQARAEMNAIAIQLERELPANRGWRTTVLTPQAFTLGELGRQYMLLLMGTSLFVLVIACVNIANLQVARASGRLREIAIRSAMGAARGRILRQLLTESIVICVLGGLAGVLAAIWGTDIIRSALPAEVTGNLPMWRTISVDARVLSYALALALLSGVLAGLLPAFSGAPREISETLKESGRTTGPLSRQRIRYGLVGGEIAVAVVLLAAAGLFVNGLHGLIDKERPFRPENVLAIRVNLPESKYASGAPVAAFYERLLGDVQAQPDVESAALASSMPHSNLAQAIRYFEREGQLPPGLAEKTLCQYQVVSPGYFQAMRVPLERGRLLGAQDGAQARPVAVISRAMARRFWPGEDPVGRRVRIGESGPWLTIAGVSGDEVHGSLDREPRAVMYVPFAQTPGRAMHLILRTAGEAKQFAPAVLGVVRRIDREQPVWQVRTYEEMIRHDLVGVTTISWLVACLGLLATVLASVGVYAVTAQAASERTHEMGVRMALGADTKAVVLAMLKHGAGVTAAGLAAGLIAASILARKLAGMIYGVSATDPTTFAVVAGALGSLALLACYVPARRVTRVDPVSALRYE